MLRPVAYWQNFPAKGNIVATIWGAGNPLTWWAVIPAMTITAVRALERPNLSRTFLVVAFLGYYLIWIPIGRVLFLYHYMPSVYIGYLALGAVLADLWNGGAELWEGAAMLTPLIAVAIVGVDHMIMQYYPGSAGTLLAYSGFAVAALLIVAFSWAALRDGRQGSRLVAGTLILVSLTLFFYYLPIWLGTPISRAGYYARMWLQGPGMQNWI
jgi:dolichyl-phosphate-mannose--protein O-mannosyl transferase